MEMRDDIRITLVPAKLPNLRTLASVSAPLNGFVDGVELLGTQAEIPPFFSQDTVGRVGHIGKHLGSGGVDQVAVTSLNGESHTAVVNESTVSNANRAAEPVRSAFSSMSGTLDVLSHGKFREPRALIRDPKSRHSVRIVAHADQSDILRSAWGSRVLVAGLLRRNAAGQPISLEMTELEVLPAIEEPMDPMLILGVDPDITEGLSTAEYLKRVRSV
jgi:hypothetical protein